MVLKVQDDLLDGNVDAGNGAQVDGQFGVDNRLVVGQSLLTFGGLKVAESVVGLGLFESSFNVDGDERTALFRGLLQGSKLSVGEHLLGVGNDDTSAGSDQLWDNEREVLLVEVVIVNQGDVSATVELVEGSLQSVGEGLDTRVLQTREVQGETLLRSWRLGGSQDLDNFSVGEPVWNLSTVSQGLSQLGTRNGGSLSTSWDCVDRGVLLLVWQVGDHSEWDNLNAQLARVLLTQLDGVVRGVEVNTLGVGTWTSMVSTDDEVGGTVVLSDDGVPERFSVTTHSHGQRQERELSHTGRVLLDDLVVHLDSGVVVNVTWLGGTDNRVDQELGHLGSGGSDGQLSVGSVQWVSGLEGDDLGPGLGAELGSQLSWRLSGLSVVVVLWQVDSVQLTTDVHVLGDVEEVSDSRMLRIASEHLFGLQLLVRGIDVTDGDDGQRSVVSWVSQDDSLACSEGFGLLLGNIQGDRHGPELTGRQSHVVSDAFVVLLRVEPGQR